MKLLKGLLWIAVPVILVFFISKTSPLLGLLFALISIGAIVFFLRADLCTAMGQMRFAKDHESGFRWFERALRSGKMRPHAQLVYTYLLLRDGHLDKAERLITKVTFLAREKLDDTMKCSAKLNMALVKWKKGNLDEAIADMEALYNEDNYRSTVHYGTLGCFYLLSGQYSKALEFNREGYEYNNTDKVIRDNLAQTHLLMGDMREAKELYEALIADEPAFLEPYYNYGQLLGQMGDYEGALKSYRKALTYEEKYLSTVTREQIFLAIQAMEARI